MPTITSELFAPKRHLDKLAGDYNRLRRTMFASRAKSGNQTSVDSRLLLHPELLLQRRFRRSGHRGAMQNSDFAADGMFA